MTPKLRLDSKLQYLKGVGPKLGELLAKRDLKTVKDLLEYYPRAFEDRRAARNIASLIPDETVSLKAQVVKVSAIPLGRTHRKMYDVLLKDSSGQIHCKYFRVPYRGYFERFRPFQEVRVVGKVTDYRGRLEFHHPDLRDVEPEEELQDALLPIYIEIENLSSARIHRLLQSVFQLISDEELKKDAIPVNIQKKYDLISYPEALKKIHQPDVEQARSYFDFKSPAHRRLIFEEFFWLELYLAAKKAGIQKEQTFSIETKQKLTGEILKNLPFELTGAQKRTFSQVQMDLAKSEPMYRLVQGDVGSGKTMVAFLAAAEAIEAGFQACLMVPTEILAEQHFKNAQARLTQAGITTALLSGKTKTAERKVILENLASGKIQFLIGTHALLEDPVQFKNLNLVIIDEQHRFGVEQRTILKQKGHSPHFLVMTATPIPRTLAMTVYGDLDVSTIDEMPPGRSPIQTRSVFETKRPQALTFMEEQIKAGRQAYIVYPLVEESEKIDLKNAVEEYDKLCKQFPAIRFGLIHGKMKSQEKDEIMNRFRQNEVQCLVSTTVIEVGVDVPNANIMIIEHAERFGLSQLHQLRGRVGRGSHKSYCILISSYAVSEEGKLRTQMMEKTTDGFKIAEFDLELRGPGEFLGTKQSGLPGFKMANLVRDVDLLQKAREAAFELLKQDPELLKPENLSLKEAFQKNPHFLRLES